MLKLILPLFILMVAGHAAQADLTFEKARWKADGELVLEVMLDSEPKTVKQALKIDTEMPQVVDESSGLTVNLKAVSDTYIVVGLVDTVNEKAYGMILERANGAYVPLNGVIIAGRPSSLYKDIVDSIAGLKEQRSWGIEQSARAMTQWLLKYPQRQAHDFLSEVKQGYIKKVPALNSEKVRDSDGITKQDTPKRRKADDEFEEREEREEEFDEESIDREPRREERRRRDDVFDDSIFGDEMDRMPSRDERNFDDPMFDRRPIEEMPSRDDRGFDDPFGQDPFGSAPFEEPVVRKPKKQKQRQNTQKRRQPVEEVAPWDTDYFPPAPIAEEKPRKKKQRQQKQQQQVQPKKRQVVVDEFPPAPIVGQTVLPKKVQPKQVQQKPVQKKQQVQQKKQGKATGGKRDKPQVFYDVFGE